jgi:hypothetical protein
MVDSLLIAQIAIFAAMFFLQELFTGSSAQILSACIVCLLFLVVASSIMLIKGRLKADREINRNKTVAKRVMNNPKVFMNLLLQQKKAVAGSPEPEMFIGSSQAPLKVVMVINLHCSPCRKAWETVTQLLGAYPQKICFTVRLTQGMNKAMGELSASTYVIRYWRQYILDHENQSSHTQQLLQTWYSRMDPKDFMKQYPLNGEKVIESNGLANPDQHYQWIEKNEIDGTPTFFVNGYKMPHQYRLKDLIPMLPGVVDEMKRN